MTKRCAECRVVKSVSEFHRHKTRSDGLQVHCKQCRKAHSKRWYQQNRDRIVQRNSESKALLRDERQEFLTEYFLSHPCVDCGEADPVVLDFDHRRGKKDFNIGQKFADVSMATLLTEIGKCDVRCANCHRRRTAKVRRTRRFRISRG